MPVSVDDLAGSTTGIQYMVRQLQLLAAILILLFSCILQYSNLRKQA